MAEAAATAALGMMAQEKNVANTSNNLANMSTTAFKQRRVNFQELVPTRLIGVGGDVSNLGAQIGSGVKVAGISPDMNQGNIQNTGRTFDMAIQGNGFFPIEMPDGTTGYTRDGFFEKNSEGTLVTVDGYTVLPSITIPENAISISVASNGQVKAQIAGESDLQDLGTIEIAMFNNPGGLDNVGGNIFVESESSGAAIIGTPSEEGYGRILQRHLESSNVNAVTEVTTLISSQRAYEMCAKALETKNEMDRATNNIRT